MAQQREGYTHNTRSKVSAQHSTQHFIDLGEWRLTQIPENSNIASCAERLCEHGMVEGCAGESQEEHREGNCDARQKQHEYDIVTGHRE